MSLRYRYKRLSPGQFSALIERAGMTVEQVMQVTGRTRLQIENFLRGEPSAAYTPTLADVLILECCARGPKMRAFILDIASSFHEGST